MARVSPGSPAVRGGVKAAEECGQRRGGLRPSPVIGNRHARAVITEHLGALLQPCGQAVLNDASDQLCVDGSQAGQSLVARDSFSLHIGELIDN
jgi:hypothetical protein